jgi:hypothetical protein
MADKFAKWDRFARHLAYTNDPHKALAWTEHETRVEAKRLKRLALLARHQVTKSMRAINGAVSKPTT